MYVWRTWLILQFFDERTCLIIRRSCQDTLKAITSEDPKLKYTADDDDAAHAAPWYYKQ